MLKPKIKQQWIEELSVKKSPYDGRLYGLKAGDIFSASGVLLNLMPHGSWRERDQKGGIDYANNEIGENVDGAKIFDFIVDKSQSTEEKLWGEIDKWAMQPEYKGRSPIGSEEFRQFYDALKKVKLEKDKLPNAIRTVPLDAMEHWFKSFLETEDFISRNEADYTPTLIKPIVRVVSHFNERAITFEDFIPIIEKTSSPSLKSICDVITFC